MASAFQSGSALEVLRVSSSSAALMLFAKGVGELTGPVVAGLLHGLKLVAIAVSRRAGFMCLAVRGINAAVVGILGAAL